jgi:cytochrome b pre-mRNA-processing protein 3
MFFRRLARKSGCEGTARRLHASATAQARRPEFYQILRAPDTIDGRFELLTLHVVLLLERLREQPAVRQDLFDTYISDLDGALREMGVGDLSMGRRMKQMGQIFYGRAAAFDMAFKALPDDSKLRDLMARTVFQGVGKGDPDRLSAYAVRCRTILEGCATDGLLAGEVEWGVP